MPNQFRNALLAMTMVAVCLASQAATTPRPCLKQPQPVPAIQARALTVPAQPDKRGTPEQPFYVQSPKDQVKEADDHSLAVWTKWLGIATFALVVVGIAQVVMFWRQLRLMVKGAKDAAIAARAAEKSADVAERSLTQLERPHVFAHVRNAGIKVVQSADGQGKFERDTLELVIFNFGRTPARLTHLQYNIDVADHGSILASIDRTQVAGRPLPVGTISANGDPFMEATPMSLKFVREEEDIISGRKSIWIVGFVRYADFFGNHHVTGFAEVLDVWNGKYVRRGDEAYNYSVEEKESDIPS